jgi:hypothetical protein
MNTTTYAGFHLAAGSAGKNRPDPSACGFPYVENTGTLDGVARTAPCA